MAHRRPRLFIGVFVLSIGSLVATVKEKCSRLERTGKSAISQPAAEPEPSAPPAPSETAQAPSETKAETPVDVATGAALLASPKPREEFVHRVAREVCPDGIEGRLFRFSPSAAVVTRESCHDIPAKTLRPGTFTATPFDEEVLIYRDHIFGKAAQTAVETVIFCSGGVDSLSRAVATELKRTVATNEWEAILFSKGPSGVEKLTFHVSSKTSNHATIYQTGQPTTAPYFALSVADVNGLIGYLSYNLNVQTQGSALAVNRRETNLSLPRCYTP